MAKICEHCGAPVSPQAIVLVALWEGELYTTAWSLHGEAMRLVPAWENYTEFLHRVSGEIVASLASNTALQNAKKRWALGRSHMGMGKDAPPFDAHEFAREEAQNRPFLDRPLLSAWLECGWRATTWPSLPKGDGGFLVMER